MFGLSLSLAKSKIKLRNEGSYLGIIWYLLSPLLFFTLLFFIFSDNIGSGIQYYPLYLLIGIIMYNFFQSTTLESADILLNNRGLIKSIKFPHESLVLATILKSLFSHLFEIVVFVIFLIIFQINLLWLIFYIPIIILFVLFVYGLSLGLSAITVYITDIRNIWDFVTKLLWFATPIFYSIGGHTRLFVLNLFNPLYYFITLTRDLLIYNQVPELWLILGTVVYSLLSFIIGFVIFNKLKKKFAEEM